VRTDKNAGRRDLPQHRVEHGTVASILDGIHPYHHAVDLQELLTNLVAELVVIDGGFRVRGSGLYLDTWVREDGAWKIKRRTVQWDLLAGQSPRTAGSGGATN